MEENILYKRLIETGKEENGWDEYQTCEFMMILLKNFNEYLYKENKIDKEKYNKNKKMYKEFI